MSAKERETVLLVAGLSLIVVLGGPLPAFPDDFIRGDANGDGRVSGSDAHMIFGYLFRLDPMPGCMNSLDVDDDETLNLADGIAILDFVVLNGLPSTRDGARRP